MHLKKISMRNNFAFCSHTVQGQCSALCSLRLAWRRRRRRRSAFAVTKAWSVDNRVHSSVSTVGAFHTLALLLLLYHPYCPPFLPLSLPPPKQDPTSSNPFIFSVCFNLYHFTLGVHSQMLWLIFQKIPFSFLSYCPLAVVLTRNSGRRQWVEQLACITKANRGEWCAEARCQFPCSWGWGKRLMVKPWKASSLLCLRPPGQPIFLNILLFFYYVTYFNIRQHWLNFVLLKRKSGEVQC